MALVQQVSGTPYISGGDTPAGTDCSGLASWTANVASGRPAFGDRFQTGNEEAALLARGFQYGTAPDALVVGWNSYHTAVTLPDGTPVSSGEGGGVRIGGGGAYQSQFTHHLYLPVDEIDEGFGADDAPEDGFFAAPMDDTVAEAVDEPFFEPVDEPFDEPIDEPFVEPEAVEFDDEVPAGEPDAPLAADDDMEV